MIGIVWKHGLGSFGKIIGLRIVGFMHIYVEKTPVHKVAIS